MAQARPCGFDLQLGDIEQVLVEAQHRWLRPPEICEIVRNYKKFNIAPEPPNMPPSGSIFLFDRKVLRYFRKDGYNWRKKKDGKTIREAHEKLKAGSVDVLHCYYAHGEDNENFQRRSYWMLEENLSHIVLVHYREVKGYRTNFNRFKEAEEAILNRPDIEQNVCKPEVENSADSSLQQNCHMLSQSTKSKSHNSTQASDYKNAVLDGYMGKSSATLLDANGEKLLHKHKKHLNLSGCEDALESHNARAQSGSVKQPICSMEADSLDVTAKQGNELVRQLVTDAFNESQAFKSHAHFSQAWQVSAEDEMRSSSICKIKGKKMGMLLDYLGANGQHLDGQIVAPAHKNQMQPLGVVCKEEKSTTGSNLTSEIRSDHFSAARYQLGSSIKVEGLKKSDSFSQWMSSELGDVEPVMQSCSDADWEAVDNRSNFPSHSSQSDFDSCVLGPSLSVDQLYRIIDFSPSWGYAGSETKVLIAGKFLSAQEGTGKCQWSCMFGEMEVPADVIAEGVLRCHTPPHGVGRVPFYVTCSNRLACSEVREFEFREKFVHSMDGTSLGSGFEALHIRFGRLLSLGSGCHQNSLLCSLGDSFHLSNEITLLRESLNDEWFQILNLTCKEDSFLQEVRERLAERLLKEKLCEWLLYNEAEGGNGPRVLDEDGQGVLHYAAALGHDWAISPIVAAGVNINFRDVRGWTALHWAASYGRERTVVYLLSLGASAGALTDPTAAYPMGRTAADLASENGHKGIAGYLAESALSSHLVFLTLKTKIMETNATEPSGITPVLSASERIAIPIGNGDQVDGIALKDSLAAVCNATQAAARIHQVYRVQSFQRKHMRDFVDGKLGSSDEQAHSVITIKSQLKGQQNESAHAAAVRIQNKFRCWKGRKEYIRIRQQIVKIQAHVRGHQVRKHYKKFVWSVGILEKVILRWRRKRTGLRGFKPESVTAELSSSGRVSREDDYDFLKEGRKQVEERLQKALSRVKSMVHYSEARDQYRRLLIAVTDIKKSKGERIEAIDNSEAAVSMDDESGGIHTLLKDDTLMPTNC